MAAVVEGPPMTWKKELLQSQLRISVKSLHRFILLSPPPRLLPLQDLKSVPVTLTATLISMRDVFTSPTCLTWYVGVGLPS